MVHGMRGDNHGVDHASHLMGHTSRIVERLHSADIQFLLSSHNRRLFIVSHGDDLMPLFLNNGCMNFSDAPKTIHSEFQSLAQGNFSMV